VVRRRSRGHHARKLRRLLRLGRRAAPRCPAGCDWLGPSGAYCETCGLDLATPGPRHAAMGRLADSHWRLFIGPGVAPDPSNWLFRPRPQSRFVRDRYFDRRDREDRLWSWAWSTIGQMWDWNPRPVMGGSQPVRDWCDISPHEIFEDVQSLLAIINSIRAGG
jgi:hypothetical protein